MFFQFFLGVWKVSNKFYLNFPTKSLISHTFDAFIVSQAGVKATRRHFGALHCEISKFKVVNLKSIKRQNMATSSQEGERKGQPFVERKITISLTTCF